MRMNRIIIRVKRFSETDGERKKDRVKDHTRKTHNITSPPPARVYPTVVTKILRVYIIILYTCVYTHTSVRVCVRVCMCACVYGPWVFSDTVAVFIVRRAVGKQIGSVTQERQRRETVEKTYTLASRIIYACIQAHTQ